MTVEEITKKVKEDDEYKFLREDPHKIALMGLGGSYAYGTNTEKSDMDIRGVMLNSSKEILLGEDFEEVVEEKTDTVLYSFSKILKLLSACNPNTIEILGIQPGHVLSVSPEGQMLIDNKDAFLSKVAIHSFGGYAIAQLRRLENLSIRESTQSRKEEHIIESIMNAMENTMAKYHELGNDNFLRLYIDQAVNPDMETEIFMDVRMNHYPLRDYRCLWSDFNSIVKSYKKIGKRNSHAIEHDKIGKHMMHLIRLFMMGLDILERGLIQTYRGTDTVANQRLEVITNGLYTNEHDFLMDIRNNKFITDDNQVKPEFYDILAEYEKQFEYAKDHTLLPEQPDFERIQRIKLAVNRSITTGEDIQKLRREYSV